MSVVGTEDARMGCEDEEDDEGANEDDEHDEGNQALPAADEVQAPLVEGEVVQQTNETERMPPEREADQLEEEQEERMLAIQIPRRVPWPLPPAPSEMAATVCLRRDDPCIAAHKALLLVDAPKNEVHSMTLKELEELSAKGALSLPVDPVEDPRRRPSCVLRDRNKPVGILFGLLGSTLPVKEKDKISEVKCYAGVGVVGGEHPTITGDLVETPLTDKAYLALVVTSKQANQWRQTAIVWDEAQSKLVHVGLCNVIAVLQNGKPVNAPASTLEKMKAAMLQYHLCNPKSACDRSRYAADAAKRKPKALKPPSKPLKLPKTQKKHGDGGARDGKGAHHVPPRHRSTTRARSSGGAPPKEDKRAIDLSGIDDSSGDESAKRPARPLEAKPKSGAMAAERCAAEHQARQCAAEQARAHVEAHVAAQVAAQVAKLTTPLRRELQEKDKLISALEARVTELGSMHSTSSQSARPFQHPKVRSTIYRAESADGADSADGTEGADVHEEGLMKVPIRASRKRAWEEKSYLYRARAMHARIAELEMVEAMDARARALEKAKLSAWLEFDTF